MLFLKLKKKKKKKKKTKNTVAWVRERTTLTELPPLVDEVIRFKYIFGTGSPTVPSEQPVVPGFLSAASISAEKGGGGGAS
jgi:hypothetical protein